MTEETPKPEAGTPNTDAGNQTTEKPFDVNTLMEEIKVEDEKRAAEQTKKLDDLKDASITKDQVKELMKDLLKKSEGTTKGLTDKISEKDEAIEALKEKLESLTGGSRAKANEQVLDDNVNEGDNSENDVFNNILNAPAQNDKNFAAIMNGSGERDLSADLEIHKRLMNGTHSFMDKQ